MAVLSEIQTLAFAEIKRKEKGKITCDDNLHDENFNSRLSFLLWRSTLQQWTGVRANDLNDLENSRFIGPVTVCKLHVVLNVHGIFECVPHVKYDYFSPFDQHNS